MKTWLTVLMVVLTDAAGDVCLTRGMKQVGEVAVRGATEACAPRHDDCDARLGHRV
jgi:hypothetical protein